MAHCIVDKQITGHIFCGFVQFIVACVRRGETVCAENRKTPNKAHMQCLELVCETFRRGDASDVGVDVVWMWCARRRPQQINSLLIDWA